MNREAARQTLELIQQHQQNFDMTNWVHFGSGTGPDEMVVSREDITADPTCGTTLCAAGFASIAAGNRIRKFIDGTVWAIAPDGSGQHMSHHQTDFFAHGADLLGISMPEASRLFTTTGQRAMKALSLLAQGDGEWFVKTFGYVPDGPPGEPAHASTCHVPHDAWLNDPPF